MDLRIIHKINLHEISQISLCTIPHHTTPGKMQYRTDGNRRILPTYFVPDPSILKFKVVARVDEIVAYMYVWSVWCGGVG